MNASIAGGGGGIFNLKRIIAQKKFENARNFSRMAQYIDNFEKT
jgi:hypothetical protein